MHRDVPFCSVITVHAENFLFFDFLLPHENLQVPAAGR